MGKYHNVLYIGMKVAWEWGVTDTETIKELLGKCSRTLHGELNVHIRFLVASKISPNWTLHIE